jgi:glycosyltransferase involved in cell wall biosynthesis
MRPRVAHIVPALFGEGGIYGGAERYARELARHMAERAPTTLVSFGPHSRRFDDGPLRVVVLGPAWHVRGQRSNPLHPGLLREVARADVVHCHQQHVLASSLAAVLCRVSGRRVYVSDLGGGGWDVSGYVSTDRWFHGHLHISEYSRSVAGHVKESRARVILGGVDVDWFRPDESVSRTNRPVVFVGRLMPHKGIIDLVDAAPPEMQVELIGRPYHTDYLAELQRRARGKNIIFRHDCDDAAIRDAYRRALCVVLPSVYRDLYGRETRVPELLGQTLLEGMACGAPALCTAVASLPEVVEDGVSGFIVPPSDPPALRDKLVWLRDRLAEAAAMGRAARERVLARFTWQAVVDRCLAAYAELPSP